MKRNLKLLSVLLVAILTLSLLSILSFADTSNSDEKFLDAHEFSYGFDTKIESKGTFSIDRFNFNNHNQYEIDGNKYIKFQPKQDGKTSPSDYVNLNFPSSITLASTEMKYLAFEFDVATESEFIDGMSIFFMGRTSTSSAGGEYLYFSNTENGFAITAKNGTVLADLGTEINEWTHVSIIVEFNKQAANESPMHFYANGVYQSTLATGFVGAGAITFPYIRLQSVNTAAAKTTQTALFDNFTVKFVSESNPESDGSIAKVLSNKETNLSAWTNSKWTTDYEFINIKYSAAIGETKYESFSEALAAAKESDTITLLKPVSDLGNIDKKVTVNTKGLDFKFTSDTIIAHKNINTYTFDNGTATVNWHLSDGTVVTEEYKSSVVPTFKGEISGYVTQKINPDGTYTNSIFTGWADDKGNSDFNANGIVAGTHDLYFKTKLTNAKVVSYTKDGSYTEYDSTAKLTDLLKDGADYVIELLDNASFTSTLNVKGNKVLNLNGYEILTNEEIHLFTIGSTVKFTVNGYGKITKNSTSKQVFINSQTADGTVITVNNVDIYSGAVLMNHKVGAAIFNGCNLVMSGDTSNAMLSATGNDNYGTSYELNNCTVDYRSSIYLFYLYTGISTVTVNNSVIKSAHAVVYSVDSPISINNSKITCERIDYKSSTTYASVGNGVYLNYTTKTDFTIPEGSKIVLTDEVGYAEVVTDSYVTVKWKVGDVSVEDIWATGSVPFTDSEEIASALAEYNTSLNDSLLTYAFNPYAVYEDTVFVPVINYIINPLFNLSIHTDIDLNLYVPVAENGATVTEIVFNGESFDASFVKKVMINDVEYYAFKRDGISPYEAGLEVDVTIKFTYQDEGSEINFTGSVISYCAEIIDSGKYVYGQEMVTLAADIIRYCYESAVYFNNSDAVYFEAMSNAFNKYTDYFSERELIVTGDDSNAKGKLYSATFKLESKPVIIFTFNENFNGRVVLKYTLDGVQHSETYNVTAGKYNDGINFISAPVDLFTVDTPITLEYQDGRTICAYTVSLYYSNMWHRSEALYTMIEAFYCYAKSAEEYAAILA